jgi:phage shock protein C
MSEVALKRCPYCAEEIRLEALKCRFCGSFVDGPAVSRGWLRSRDGKMIAGVCAGLAREFSVPVTVLRLAFVRGTLFGGGIGIIVYLVLWVVMPYEPTFGGMVERYGESERRDWP